jgi:hypothetical protein
MERPIAAGDIDIENKARIDAVFRVDRTAAASTAASSKILLV